MNPELRRTPLWEAHRAAGARLVEFAGWEMPVQYRGINEEQQAVRNRAGVFDVSHMGKVLLEGSGALRFLQHLLPPDLGRLGVGRIAYAVMCAPDGGALDDLLVYRVGQTAYLLVVNASRLDDDLNWISCQAGAFQGVGIDGSQELSGILAVQGPLAETIVGGLFGHRPLELDYLECAQLEWSGTPLMISRSGYTGEDGFELICPNPALAQLWGELVALGAQPCGLGARDVLRTEMGYCLYGHELGTKLSPLDAGLAWSVDLGKEPAFVGQHSLRRQQEAGLKQRLVGLRLEEQGIPRPGCRLLDGQGLTVGTISSGTYSPSLERGIALAYVAPSVRRPGTDLWVDLRGRSRRAVVVRTPFVPSRIKRKGRK